MGTDILERMGNIVDGLEHSSDILPGEFYEAMSEIRSLRMVISSSAADYALNSRGSYITRNDIILAALNGSAAQLAARHDFTCEKLIAHAINLGNTYDKVRDGR